MAKIFVSGTDTGVGKTAATGWLAKMEIEAGRTAATQKLVQTGCSGISADILEHRRIMGVQLLPEDLDFTTCRYVAKFPASPHLAFAMEGRSVDYSRAAADGDMLEKKYGTVFIEGAGGLLVPLAEGLLTADYVEEHSLPLALVVPSRLGSLNHALLSLEYCRDRGLELWGVVYNTYPQAPAEIEDSTRAYLKKYLAENFAPARFLEMGRVGR